MPVRLHLLGVNECIRVQPPFRSIRLCIGSPERFHLVDSSDRSGSGGSFGNKDGVGGLSRGGDDGLAEGDDIILVCLA
jgi:hypothetical protein